MCINLKYNIRKRLLDMPGDFLQNKYKLAIELCISERTIDKWCGLEKGVKYSIQSDLLFQIAKYFNCQLSDLLN